MTPRSCLMGGFFASPNQTRVESIISIRKPENRRGHNPRLTRKHRQKPVPEGSPEKPNHGIKIPSPLKQKIESPPKSQTEQVFIPESPAKPAPSVPATPCKNIANNRLSHLREQLNAEVQALKQGDAERSPQKNKLKISPKASQSETQAKTPNIKSPNLNESKCSTSQSPSSDSGPSIPSPSQFFAANKIICSMKAQLPEEYSSRIKPIDTFAAIEEGICNQITEYPYMKHPATPPQFSEASKLLSAIKSKLSGKVSCRDLNLKTFTSAKERMENLRSRLSNETENEVCKEITNEEYLSNIELPPTEDMEVEECKEIKQNVPSFQCTKDNVGNKENIVLVVDTNIFIHELDVIKNVLNSHIKGYSEQPNLLVPWRVINELDRLKDNNNGNGAICKRARSAMDYLYKSLPENNRIKGQSLRDANSHIYPCESPDDEILNCCLQQAERGKSVILLSNDKNLCNKAAINGVKCIGLDELKSLLENKPHPAPDPDLYASVKHYEAAMYQLLANILENEMRAKYNNLWQHVLFKAPPWSFADVVQCLLKHWIAVFNEVFPRIEHLFTDLNNTLTSIENKDPKSLSQSEVLNYKELCLEIAKKCQIIPEYMELAKATVERLSRKSETKDPERKGEMVVIDAFEAMWTVFSSYCAKLCTAVNVPHSLEDKLPSNDTLPELTSKWPLFNSQLRELTSAMNGLEDKLPSNDTLPELTSKWPLFNSQLRELTSAMNGLLSTTPGDPSIEEHVGQLEIVFKESLAIISYDTHIINTNSMRVFCTNCRNMLQEAFSKFSELVDLLDVCRTNIANQ
ncbi:PIN domain-containing protein [Phthorimaea operculella]|nr:PIN domain-containing protein [Phthorimaea operculella]